MAIRARGYYTRDEPLRFGKAVRRGMRRLCLWVSGIMMVIPLWNAFQSE
jgi:hypothetical protein